MKTETANIEEGSGRMAATPARLLDKERAAAYVAVSVDTLERLIYAGKLPIVRLPVERGRSGKGQIGASRRVLIDVRDLDSLIDRSKETCR